MKDQTLAMIKKNANTILVIIAMFAMTSGLVSAQDVESKKKKLSEYRIHFSEKGYRSHDLRKYKGTRKEALELLRSDGLFKDQVEVIDQLIDEQWGVNPSGKVQSKLSNELEYAYRRYWFISEKYRGFSSDQLVNEETVRSLLAGVIKIGKIELERLNVSSGRFHSSCFAIPTAAVNMYFCFFDLMEKVEEGSLTDSLFVEANKVLKEVGMQAWTQPYRNDETDKNVVQVERFRNHVWWVGGNGIAYRSVLPAAAMMNSVEMMDVLADVAKGAISTVSQNTFEKSFWTEGFTADGAGWGHGMQCLIWGYPIHGTSAALSLLGFFRDSPWEGQLSVENVKALMNFLRGSSWYYHNGFIPPCLDRGSMAYKSSQKEDIPNKKLLKTILEDWRQDFSTEELKELEQLYVSFDSQKVQMPGMPVGFYGGTRWFYNNDDLLKKTDDYYIFVNMASVRCDGIESAHTMADGYNFFTCDGMTLFQRNGDEYHRAKGAWNLTAIPGVTSRQGEEHLKPITNWRGYCSKHNFAAAATSGTKNAAAGFKFEKLNASSKKMVNDKTGLDDKNEWLYGIKAHKFYFMFDDMMLALGAGITNLQPELEGEVWTTIDQTVWQDKLQYKSGQESYFVDKEIKEVILKPANEKKPLSWISQFNGFTYAILPEQTPSEVSFSAETRPTQWDKINGGNKQKKGKTDSEKIFQLWINHGRKVVDDTYGYLVYAGDEIPANVFKKSPVQVLSNTTDLQAASNREGTVTGAAFYNVGSLLKTKKWELEVSAPCALLVELENGKCQLSVTDAEMNEDLKEITIKTTLSVTGAGVMKDGKWNVVQVKLPQGPDCGKPASVVLNMNK
jgi:hypothetical protein